ncbi:MAG: class I SAM-dependent methyltransferase [Stenotrophobium sp.]
MQTLLNWYGRELQGATLELAAPDGRVWTLGRGEPHARIKLRDQSTLWNILANPALRLGETYMDRAWEPENGELMPVLEVCMRLLGKSEFSHGLLNSLKLGMARFLERNTPHSSESNAAHHYNLDAKLYRYFLDEDMHYSCAYFPRPGMTLEEAQQAKCAHIARKLNLKPGAKIFSIGCGWGGLALYLARHHGAHVVGTTLSSEQLTVARQRAQERGLTDQVEFRLEDYRKTQGEFDAIVSVGMFEHVGRPQYRTFFDKARELLKPDGTMLLHSIGRLRPPGRANPWIRKYIFPGGYVPAASEMLSAIEPSGLLLNDFEVWRLHYAKTLAEWHRRFQASRTDMSARLGEKFCRMWTFYLQSCEAAFRWGGLAVFHAQLTRNLDRLPLTRDYLYR